MKSYIFREREVRIIKVFLEKGEKLEGWRDVKHRIRQYHRCIKEHYRLMEQVLEKIQESS